MLMSESIKSIASALVKFQSEVEAIRKKATNPFYRSKYATLSDIFEAIRQPLSDNGLAVSQFPAGDDQLTTILMHNSGEYMLTTVTIRPVKNDPQALGSAITYMRRYALVSVLGLSIDDDDDGNKASGKDVQTTAAFGNNSMK